MKHTALQQNGHPADPLTSESQLKTESNLVTPSAAPVTVRYVCKTVGGGVLHQIFTIYQVWAAKLGGSRDVQGNRGRSGV